MKRTLFFTSLLFLTSATAVVLNVWAHCGHHATYRTPTEFTGDCFDAFFFKTEKIDVYWADNTTNLLTTTGSGNCSRDNSTVCWPAMTDQGLVARIRIPRTR